MSYAAVSCRCLYPANDTQPIAPCCGVFLEERIWAGGDGAIVLCCPKCEIIYQEIDEHGQQWHVEEIDGLLIRTGPSTYKIWQ